MSQRNPADEALKAAWLAKNPPTECPALPAAGYSQGFADQAFALISNIAAANGCGRSAERREIAREAMKAEYRRFKKSQRFP